MNRQSPTYENQTLGTRVAPESAWAAYWPTPESPWTLAKAGHLLRRVGWGGNWQELQDTFSDGPQKALERLLRRPPDWEAFHQEFDELLFRAARTQGEVGLAAWWLRRMIVSPYPLEEKLLLFWHSHFAVSARRVGDPVLMADYLQKLRKVAFGSWEEVLSEVTQHPAFLLSAGATAHRRAQPNTAWGKYFLTHIGFGPHGLSLASAEEVARVWTGWFVVNKNMRFVISEHDPRPKELLGETGDLQVADLVRLVASHPASHTHIVRKLYRWFVSDVDDPTDEFLAPLAGELAQKAPISRVLERMFRSLWFFSEAAYRAKIKSPVDLAVGICRTTSVIQPTTPLANALSAIGQDLCNPPTFDGWPGGQAWINPHTYLARKNFAASLLHGLPPYRAPDLWELAHGAGITSLDRLPQFYLELLYQGDLDENTRERLSRHWEKLRSETSYTPGGLAKSFILELIKLPEFELV